VRAGHALSVQVAKVDLAKLQIEFSGMLPKK